MAVINKPVVVRDHDHPGDSVLSLAMALVVASPDGAETLLLSAEHVVDARCKTTSCAATGVSGYVLGARRGLRSGCRVLTLTAAPRYIGGIVI